MEVKGTAFLARKTLLVHELGEEKFTRFLERFAEKEPVFREPILATSLIPIKPFLALNDAIVAELYGGDIESYFRVGAASAEWSLTQGPYKHMRETKSLDSFAGMGRVLYANFFTKGRAETVKHGNRVELRISEVAREYHHPYFEYAICGYFKRGLELVGGGRVDMKRIRGFTKGDADVFYEFHLS
ncbi:hypothetical protein [Sandaracinus amylolyticus]|uniref:Uncharacterized protein n=1 Tax=Sandaracinus amylolyticus TaxID=927083 RepID=A0A0F6WA80_9BACT|nr:hypothetical protein [Sandaracinus amylolyticus]AKF11367.1 hypothetical protein DB32_008516 [Sandaracinus amylolyticus]